MVVSWLRSLQKTASAPTLYLLGIECNIRLRLDLDQVNKRSSYETLEDLHLALLLQLEDLRLSRTPADNVGIAY